MSFHVYVKRVPYAVVGDIEAGRADPETYVLDGEPYSMGGPAPARSVGLIGVWETLLYVLSDEYRRRLPHVDPFVRVVFEDPLARAVVGARHVAHLLEDGGSGERRFRVNTPAEVAGVARALGAADFDRSVTEARAFADREGGRYDPVYTPGPFRGRRPLDVGAYRSLFEALVGLYDEAAACGEASTHYKG